MHPHNGGVWTAFVRHWRSLPQPLYWCVDSVCTTLTLIATVPLLVCGQRLYYTDAHCHSPFTGVWTAFVRHWRSLPQPLYWCVDSVCTTLTLIATASLLVCGQRLYDTDAHCHSPFTGVWTAFVRHWRSLPQHSISPQSRFYPIYVCGTNPQISWVLAMLAKKWTAVRNCMCWRSEWWIRG